MKPKQSWKPILYRVVPGIVFIEATHRLNQYLKLRSPEHASLIHTIFEISVIVVLITFVVYPLLRDSRSSEDDDSGMPLEMNNPNSVPESIQNVLPPTRSPRPIYVWLSLLLFAYFGAIFTLSFATVIDKRIVMPVDVLWRLTAMAIVTGALYGIWHRHQWARWLGVLVIVAVGVFSLFGLDSTFYANNAERTVSGSSRFFFAMVWLWWIYEFGFSEKSKLYWN